MKPIDSKNIFDVVKKGYAANQPKKNGRIDPIYSLFGTLLYLSVRNSRFSQILRSARAAKHVKSHANSGTSWSPIRTTGPATAMTTRETYPQITGVM